MKISVNAYSRITQMKLENFNQINQLNSYSRI